MGASESVIRAVISGTAAVFVSIVGRCRRRTNTDDEKHDDANKSDGSQKSYAHQSTNASAR